MLVTLITPTGARPSAFRLCERFMAAQTYKGELQWLVVDDAEPKTRLTLGQTSIVGPKKWRQGLNTQRPNLDAAIPHIKGDFVLIIEDDDWYSPRYIETMVYFLQKFPLVGEGNARYYNITWPGFKEMRNYQHASLCQTGFRADELKFFEEAVNSGELYFDINLWRRATTEGRSTLIFQNKGLSVGMKGLPGRGGIGIGHKQTDYILDRSFLKLKEWVGADADAYIKMREPNGPKKES